MDIDSVLLLRISSVVDKDVDHPQFFDPPYPLKYLQAGLDAYKDLTVNFLDCWIHPMSVPDMLAQIDGLHPDLVVISSSSFEVQVSQDLVEALKQRTDCPLLLGIGQSHYMTGADKDHPQPGYDAILLGEPELEFFQLFDWIQRSQPSDTDWREHYQDCFEKEQRFVVEDPDALAFPTYTPDELESYRSIFPVQVSKRVVWGYLIATRGCPHGCMFCSEVMRVSVGTRVRCRSAANVADEMEHLAAMGANICSFQDDSFSANKSFVRAMCAELIKRKSTMPWMARVRVDELDYELLAQMKQAGCVMLGLGVESGSQRIVEAMVKQRNPKPWAEQCRAAFGWARKLGIGTNAYYVLGNPTETREEIEATIRLALELKSDTIQVHFYTPYPGSAAWEKYQDVVKDYDPAQMFHYATPMFTLADISIEDLVKLRSTFYRRYIYRPTFALTHFWKHAGFYWHNRDILMSLVGIRKVF
ncbi:B12-binding domain-containing radical SAM protein [Planctomycetota bacterium]